MKIPYVEQIRIGKLKQLEVGRLENASEVFVKTDIFKEEQKEKIYLTSTGLKGDESLSQNRKEKALYAYPIHHYDYWLEQLSLGEFDTGAMGEHLVLSGVDEFSTFIGDTYEMGEAIVQVSQPHQPCWHIAQRFNEVDLPLHIQESGRTGWHYRVIKEGDVQSGDEMNLIERPYPQWSIAFVNEILYKRKNDLRLTYELNDCSLLAPRWRRMLTSRLRGKELSMKRRLYGNISTSSFSKELTTYKSKD